MVVTTFLQSICIVYFLSPVDDPVELNQLIESLPALTPCELVDPADDQSLPRLIEVLERRQHIRQIITKQVNQTGTFSFYLLFDLFTDHCIYLFCQNCFKPSDLHEGLFTANTLKSMLQQFDNQLGEKETFLHDQQNKLKEKDKVILNQKTEIDRLEKKSKTLEYKVWLYLY